MQSLVIRIDPKPLTNADLDLRYEIPDWLSHASEKKIKDAGYDFEPSTDALHIYLAVEDANAAVPLVIQLVEGNTLEEPGLLRAVRVGVSEFSVSESSSYRTVYPSGNSEAIERIR
jgi:hypothetical protein